MKDFEANAVTEGMTPEMFATVYPHGQMLLA